MKFYKLLSLVAYFYTDDFALLLACIVMNCFNSNVKYLIIVFLFRIEVFDSDKLGKDKSLGKVEISQDDLGANQPIWFPLAGVKSGQILLNTELLAPGEAPSGYIGDGQDAPVYGGAGDSSSRKPSSQADGKKTGLPSDYDGPVLHIDLVRAKDLIKTDMIGKSDPYAVLKYDNQQDKTPVAKNTQNPIWDHKSDFAMDPQNSETLM